jgi:hypothetical protein
MGFWFLHVLFQADYSVPEFLPFIANGWSSSSKKFLKQSMLASKEAVHEKILGRYFKILD